MRPPLNARGALAVTLTLALLSACSRQAPLDGSGSILVTDHAVRISVSGAPTASVQSSGDIAIGSHPVPLTAPQQALAQHYYQDAVRLEAAGESTGKAGGRAVVSMLGSLGSALWHDDASTVNRAAHQDAANIKARVSALCGRMSALRGAQNALIAVLPAFAPYRVIHAHQVAHCLRGVERAGGPGA